MQGSQTPLSGVMMNWTAAGASVHILPFSTQAHKQQANNNFIQKQIQLIQTHLQYCRRMGSDKGQITHRGIKSVE
jgi:hypothetical protein